MSRDFLPSTSNQLNYERFLFYFILKILKDHTRKKISKNQTFTLLINSFSHELSAHHRLLPDGTPYKKLLLRH